MSYPVGNQAAHIVLCVLSPKERLVQSAPSTAVCCRALLSPPATSDSSDHPAKQASGADPLSPASHRVTAASDGPPAAALKCLLATPECELASLSSARRLSALCRPQPAARSLSLAHSLAVCCFFYCAATFVTTPRSRLHCWNTLCCFQNHWNKESSARPDYLEMGEKPIFLLPLLYFEI